MLGGYGSIRPIQCRSRGGAGGFTLLEISIVLVIIAVILAGGAVVFAVSLQKRQVDDTRVKIATVQKALFDYWQTFGRLPCPGDIVSFNPSQNQFGREASNAYQCSGVSPATYVYNLTSGNSTRCNHNGSTFALQDCVYGGLVPTKTLRLSEEYAFDGWGRRLLYAVDGDYNQSEARSTLTDITETTTRIVILAHDQDATPITSSAAYVIVSFGPNGHGAYGRYTMDISLSFRRQDQPETYQLASLDPGPFDKFRQPQTATDWTESRWVGPPIYQLAQSAFSSVGLAPIPAPRLTAGSSDTMELENCDCDDHGITGTFDNVFYGSQGRSRLNDDIVVYATRASLRSAFE